MGETKLSTTRKEVGENNRRHFKYRSNECLNCGQPLDLSDVYCPYCSQLNSTKQLSLKDFFSEFLNSIVSYDSRLRYTVSDLLFRPGIITKRYVEGKRLKYANPFRFFLSVSIIYFLLNGLVTTFSPDASPFININDTSESNTTGEELEQVSEDFKIDPNDLPLTAQEMNTDSIQELAQKRIKAAKRKEVKEAGSEEKEFQNISEKSLDTLTWGNRFVERFTLYNKFYEHSEIKNASVALDSLGHANTTLNRWMYNKNKTIERIEENPYGFFNYMTSKTPFFLFFFTPFFAFFFWLIYSKKKYTYVEHIIFIFHIFSFLFLSMLLILLPDLILGSELLLAILFLIIGPFYFYKALRNFYKQSRIITILKFVFLNIVFLVSATFAAVLFFSVTAAIY
jgi:Protein of unknown function (DUF3667)